MSIREKNLNFVDLFAGCGGLSLGLEEAGFRPVFVNELNEDALATYLVNRKDEFPYLSDEPFFSKDVKDLVLDSKKLDVLKSAFKEFHNIDVDGKNGQDLDLLVGGPPCQGYSGIGHRRSYSVDKKQLISNHLYQDMAFLIAQLRPRMFLFENVRGLLNSKWTSDGTKGEIWKDVRSTFENLEEYSIRYSLVYAKDYGVPQNRPRVLLVGIRNDLQFKFSDDDAHVAGGLLPNPSDYPNTPPHLEDLLSDLIDPNYKNGGTTETYPTDPQNEVQSKLRMDKDGHAFQRGDQLIEQEYSKHRSHVRKKFKHMIKNGGKIPPRFQTKKFSQKVLKPIWNENGPSITATSLPDDYIHWAQPRTLTVREWARLQTFPDWYEFKGKRTTGGIRRAGNPRESIYFREVPKYTQIGNAVPVWLANSLGKHFKKILLSTNYKS